MRLGAVLTPPGPSRPPGHGPEGHGTEVFGALRLPNGNTLIAGGNNNRVLEVSPEGQVVRSVGHDELTRAEPRCPRRPLFNPTAGRGKRGGSVPDPAIAPAGRLFSPFSSSRMKSVLPAVKVRAAVGEAC
jgi:hypothetical protein